MTQNATSEPSRLFPPCSALIGFMLLATGSGLLGTSKTKPFGVVLFTIACAFFVACAVSASRLGPSKRTKIRIDASKFWKPEICIRPRQRCPYCHDSLAGPAYTCAGCNARYHAECLDELGGCTTLGCVNAAPRRRARA